MATILTTLVAGPSGPLVQPLLHWVLAGAALTAPHAPTSSTQISEAPPAATRLIDLDGDGALDILSQRADGQLSIRMHTGGRQFVDVHQNLPHVHVTDALSTDLDGDGTLDLYLVTPGQDVALLGDGNGRFENATQRLGLVSVGVGLSAERSDLDGDGIEELIVHNEESDVLFWAEADGSFVREERTADGKRSVSPMVTVEQATQPGQPNLDQASPEATRGSRGVRRPIAALPVSGPTVSPSAAVSGTATNLFSFFVVDNAGEVDSADVADGSLIGADVSTTSGDVSHSGGNVGIGTASPAEQLDVVGSSSFNGPMELENSGLFPALHVKGGSGFFSDDGGDLDSSVSGGVRVFLDSVSQVGQVNAYDYNLDVPLNMSLQQTGGNLGIGTLLPTAPLHVVGDARFDSNVGIGTTTPATPLDVDGATTLDNAGDIPALTVTGSGFFGSDSGGLNTSVGAGVRVFHEGDGQIFAYDYGTATPTDLVLQGPGGRIGIGTSTPATTLDINGALTIRGGADIVERFDIAGTDIQPGTVVVIDADQPGDLCVATKAYDRRVAGIVSGAGGVKPGICLGQEGVMDGEVPVAMTGRVYVRACAENGAIQPGDRLTTADLAGHAMRATDDERCAGAILGKAMSSLDAGTGLVLVLVNLQ